MCRRSEKLLIALNIMFIFPFNLDLHGANCIDALSGAYCKIH